MTAKYEQLGIRFLYPENWELDNQLDASDPWSVSVHSPSGAFWSVAVYENEDDAASIGSKSLKAVEEEYKESYFESEPIQEDIAGHKAIGYDLRFYYLDFLISASLRSLRFDDRCCVILCQGEDRDFDENQQVFRAITHSLFMPIESDIE